MYARSEKRLGQSGLDVPVPRLEGDLSPGRRLGSSCNVEFLIVSGGNNVALHVGKTSELLALKMLGAWDALVDSDGPLRRGDNGAPADVSRHHCFVRRIWNDGQELLVLLCSQVPDVRLAIGAAAYEDFGSLETN